MRERPITIEKYWYSIDWDVPALWALELPIEQISFKTLEWHLDVPVWPDPRGRDYRVTPRQVMDYPEIHAFEFERIQTADLSFPLEVYPNLGRLMILDGIHRFCHALLRGDTEVRVRRIPHGAVRRLTHDKESLNSGT